MLLGLQAFLGHPCWVQKKGTGRGGVRPWLGLSHLQIQLRLPSASDFTMVSVGSSEWMTGGCNGICHKTSSYSPNEI